MPRPSRDFIRRRAQDRCEYCRILQSAEPLFTFHVEHIVARQHGGGDVPDNLALACHHCNLHKGPNLSGMDPAGGETERLFHPRTDLWGEYFELAGGRVVGRTAVGRTTVRLLQMNDELRVELRLVESRRDD